MSTQTVNVPPQGAAKPLAFLASIRESYESGTRVQIVTGDTTGLFWNESEQEYTPLDQVLLSDLGRRFTIVSLDAVGLGFFDSRENAEAFIDVYAKGKLAEQGQKRVRRQEPPAFQFRDSFDDPQIKSMLVEPRTRDEFDKAARNKITQGRFDPLAGLAVLKEFFRMYTIMRQRDRDLKPLCIIVRHAGALFPDKDWALLDQADRQRLVYFLNMIGDPEFLDSRELFVLLNTSRAEINQRISASTAVNHLEIQLPNEQERAEFIGRYLQQKGGALLEMEPAAFARFTASLPLANIKSLLDVAGLSKRKVSRADVNAEINKALKARIGKNVTFLVPSHGIAEVDEQEELCRELVDVLLDCDNPETAVAAILLSGPNGSGKTWIAEGVTKDCGRVAIVLSGLKDSSYGGTEKIIENLYLVAKTFSNMLFVIDEADTKVGNVRNESQTHEVTRDLYGSLAIMMADPSLLGRVVWMLMTCRPDKFGADIMDRCSVKFGVFDTEGERRKRYIQKQFQRKKLELKPEELETVIQKTNGLSNRNITDMIKLFRGRLRRKPDMTIGEFLAGWNANNSISIERRMQTLIAVQNCTYSSLLPDSLKNMKPEEIQKELQLAKMLVEA